MTRFFPEGYLLNSTENSYYLKSSATLKEAQKEKVILEARAIVCDSAHNLTVDLGCMKGTIARSECAIGIEDGTTRDIAIISKVNKPVCFRVIQIKSDDNGVESAVLSRKAVQEDCEKNYISTLSPGDIIGARVTHLEPFGAFVDIGCGIISLIPIDAISVSRISHPRDRFYTSQNIKAIVKSVAYDGKICLSHKELLGTWEENANKFAPGETVAGIVRSVESYGVFIELAPNLAGLAELKGGVKVGQNASVYIKNMIPEKMKIKLIIVEAFDETYETASDEYFYQGDKITHWRYSPLCCDKIIESSFSAGK
ncbi:MAG: S1 RNA-binding domain-containing protein [Oscillospiraceae bacterium]